MRSLRASATIMIFLIRPPAFPTRSRNQADKVLSGCQRSHSQASSTLAARTRLLPSLPIPCSRSLPPLENGVQMPFLGRITPPLTLGEDQPFLRDFCLQRLEALLHRL